MNFHSPSVLLLGLGMLFGSFASLSAQQILGQSTASPKASTFQAHPKALSSANGMPDSAQHPMPTGQPVSKATLPSFLSLSQPIFVKSDKGLVDWLQANYAFSPEIGLSLLTEHTDEQGNQHQRYQLQWHGIPLAHAQLLLHRRQGKIYAINGVVPDSVTDAPQASLSEAAALEAALTQTRLSQFLWENPQAEQALKMENQDPTATYYPRGELVYVSETPGSDPRTSPQVLAWKFLLHDQGGQLSTEAYVHARSGAWLGELSRTAQCETGQGTTSWYGVHGFPTQQSGQTNILLDDCQAAYVHTLNWNDGQTYLEYQNLQPQNQWANDPVSQSAVTAHWGTVESARYFQEEWGRNGWDDQGSPVLVLNQMAGGDENNAGFNDCLGRMYLGAGSTSSPLDDWNTLDVVAHELMHGVTGSSAGLIYRGESGAINEGYSDAFGTVIEYWMAQQNGLGGTQPDFLLREDHTAGYIRNMADPNDKGHPDTYGQNNFWVPVGQNCNVTNDYCGVHTNSGVFNHWFYLLSEGGSGINANGFAYSVLNLGIETAAEIAYHTLINYLTPTSDFEVLRDASVQAAVDLFGAASLEAIQVRQAWDAVGVSPDLRFTPFFSTPEIGATTLEVFVQVENIGLGTSIPTEILYTLTGWSSTHEIGVEDIPTLAPGDSVVIRFAKNVFDIVPTIPGGYYSIDFQIDHNQLVPEQFEGNNAGSWGNSPSFQMPNSLIPNLTFNWDYGDFDINGNDLTYHIQMVNNGSSSANNSTIRCYLSFDTNLSTTFDYYVGGAFVGPLGAGDTMTISIPVNVLTFYPNLPAGDYYMMIELDSDLQISEWDESDNDGYFTAGRYSYGSRNLTYTGYFANPIYEGPQIDVGPQVVNRGSLPTAASSVKWYLSTDQTISSFDREIDDVPLPALTSGATFIPTLSVDVSTLSPPLANGTYYLGFIIDPGGQVSESLENDNVASWPDHPFVYQAPQANLTYEPGFSRPTIDGQLISTQLKVVNRGTLASPASIVRFVLSDDLTANSNDPDLLDVSLPPLQAGAEIILSTPVMDALDASPALTPGNYFLGFRIDPDNQIVEWEENDNAGIWACPQVWFNQTDCSTDALEPSNLLTEAHVLAAAPSQQFSDLCLTVYDQDWFRFEHGGVPYFIVSRGRSPLISGSYDFSFDLQGNTLIAETSPASSGNTPDTYLALYAENSTTPLAYDDNGGQGSFSRLNYSFSPASTEGEEVAAWVRAYPNPSQGQLMIQTLSPSIEAGHLSLYNSLGQVIREEQVVFASQADPLNWSLQGLPNGVYLLEVVREKERQTIRVVLQR